MLVLRRVPFPFSYILQRRLEHYPKEVHRLSGVARSSVHSLYFHLEIIGCSSTTGDFSCSG